MDREYEGQARREAMKQAEQSLERTGIVHVGRPVEGDQAVAARLQPKPPWLVQRPRSLELPEQGIDHDVADETDLLRRDALGRQVSHSRRIRNQQEIRDRISQKAIHLLRHRAVEASESRLHVNDRDPDFHGG